MLHDFAAPLPQAEEELPPHVHFHSSKPSTLLRTRATHTEAAGSRRGGAAAGGGGGGVAWDVARVLARGDRGACRCAPRMPLCAFSCASCTLAAAVPTLRMPSASAACNQHAADAVWRAGVVFRSDSLVTSALGTADIRLRAPAHAATYAVVAVAVHGKAHLGRRLAEARAELTVDSPIAVSSAPPRWMRCGCAQAAAASACATSAVDRSDTARTRNFALRLWIRRVG
jgi:hypothetical protein